MLSPRPRFYERDANGANGASFTDEDTRPLLRKARHRKAGNRKCQNMKQKAGDYRAYV